MTPEQLEQLHREATAVARDASDLARRIDAVWQEAQRLNAKANSVAWLVAHAAGVTCTTTTPPPTHGDAVGPGQGLGGNP